MKKSSICLYAVLIVLFLFNVTINATEAQKTVKPKAYEASALPGFDLTPKRELVKFVPCSDENDCYRALQESDVDTAQAGKSNEGVALVAEFVDGPQKGIRVYRNK